MKNNNIQENLFFNLDNFSGPLDLLLSLVKEKNIDIMQINLVELANRYLEIINHLKANAEDYEIEKMSEYLVLATKLLEIKTKMLLEEKEESMELKTQKNEILQRLIEYKQLKEVQPFLRKLEKSRNNIFIKDSNELEQWKTPPAPEELHGKGNPLTLIKILRDMFARVHALNLRTTKIKSINLTAQDQIEYIRKLFKEYENVTFEMIFNLPSIQHFVITLIALLDLVKRQEIRMYQEIEYGPIRIEKGEIHA
ncbi:segregation/condensation protein A [Mycoplasma phocimorsus]|uniref:Segregation and condensation protein A n=1 Tax=Mycoplasma phocimorsus TaxID=3045839 RepID=A0AAJ1PSL2_9MOLU|nr:segregation/condensation protein A [Mycoplasma phocimorsus]MDJ1646008.1 segregation/condensation protein A [Mycoplasma phocimorsus]MDJ1646288.1 segregation/condensation protein A [Mycoplasma phocimorsus]MDJ1646892.1 segregation/condensation protein A [Mycoplasma phocimorsus]MDJ1647859.1 segregation/condensation protein A [Mycoplasma phocimorsus]MDJ1648440.1 segregation/condensation protein A [Mycoplasma phocimorsus]